MSEGTRGTSTAGVRRLVRMAARDAVLIRDLDRDRAFILSRTGVGADCAYSAWKAPATTTLRPVTTSSSVAIGGRSFSPAANLFGTMTGSGVPEVPLEIEAPNTTRLRGEAIRMAIGILIAGVVALMVLHFTTSVVVICTLVVLWLGFVGFIALTERSQRKRQEGLMANLPPGAIFACRAMGRHPTFGGLRAIVEGTLLIDHRGITFESSKTFPFAIAWEDVDHARLSPEKFRGWRGIFVLYMKEGEKSVFSANQFAALADALEELRS